VKRLVNEWWEGKKALGQSGLNAGTLRRWLIDGRSRSVV
jgi:hypothetical protein